MQSSKEYFKGAVSLLTFKFFLCAFLQKFITVPLRFIHISVGIQNRLLYVECKADFFVGHRFSSRSGTSTSVRFYFFGWFYFRHIIYACAI